MLIPTLRNDPKDAEATSHRLMFRAGLIRKLSSGVYSYLPLGYRVLKNVINIIRDEMNKAGALEVLLPVIHPAEIWHKTGRYEMLKDILMTVKKEDKNEFVLGPTHEEIITELVSGYVSSYKDLPLNLYQIQTKFRDEARPRFGIIRSKEFIMKDAYSFDSDTVGLNKSYEIMYETYKRIFERCGLDYVIVTADSGAMGGDVSHEFMVKVPFGEDIIVSCSECDLSSSLEVAPCKDYYEGSNDKPNWKKMEEFDTPNLKTIEDISGHFNFNPEDLLKTIIYIADGKPIACIVSGECEICEAKLKKYLKTEILSLADENIIKKVTGAPLGFSGPVGLKQNIPIICDFGVRGKFNCVTGANKKDKHLKNVNIGRDFECKKFADIRYIKEGDVCPICSKGKISLERSLEIGHVFKLGKKYSKDLNAKFTDKDGKEKNIIMGCYGIGVNRIMAACIELHSDEKGIKWPVSIAPFKILLLTVNQKQEKSVQYTEELYKELLSKSYDVLYDDRDIRAGVKFNDADLIGIPIVVVIGDRNLKDNLVEIKTRNDGKSKLIPTSNLMQELKQMIDCAV